MSDETTSASTKTYCVNHPNRETYLRCNRCDRPICSECAVLTPTGYRCKDCVRSQQKVYDTAQWIDYPIAVVVAAGVAFAGSYLASILGFFTIFIAPLAGVVIAEIVRFLVQRRRSRLLSRLATGAAVAGSLPLLLWRLLAVLLVMGSGSAMSGLFGLLPLVWQAVYTFLMASTLYYRLSGIQIR
ncbi:MAG: hypothetical protein GYA17_20225 [Chloroflexi bacterium]|nr:hypothetical protein [Chloroflexota bacterium]